MFSVSDVNDIVTKIRELYKIQEYLANLLTFYRTHLSEEELKQIRQIHEKIGKDYRDSVALAKAKYNIEIKN